MLIRVCLDHSSIIRRMFRAVRLFLIRTSQLSKSCQITIRNNCGVVAVERELKQLDDRLIKLLAYQRIQHLLSQNDGSNQSLATLITNSVQNSKPLRHMPLPSELLTPADIDRISRVFTSPKKAKITR